MKDKDNNYVIVSDSSCDLPDELIKENNSSSFLCIARWE